MSEYTPITGELRAAIARAEHILPLTEDAPLQVRMRLDFLKDRLDAIDAIHRGLEQENERLRRERDSALAELVRLMGEVEE